MNFVVRSDATHIRITVKVENYMAFMVEAPLRVAFDHYDKFKRDNLSRIRAAKQNNELELEFNIF